MLGVRARAPKAVQDTRAFTHLDSIPTPCSLPLQLPCFGYGKPLDALRARFRLELSPAQAAGYMRGLILGAYDKWTTGGYDYIQYLQNAIPK